jgi:hypothetical protein
MLLLSFRLCTFLLVWWQCVLKDKRALQFTVGVSAWSSHIFVYPCAFCHCFSCCCVCLRSCVLAYAHVYILCPYACNRLQLLQCFCTPVGQIVRLYTCMIELLTTVCLYAGMVLVGVPTLLCICVDAWLYVCMPLSLCFCVLCWMAVNLLVCVCSLCPFCLCTCALECICAYVPVAWSVCQCFLSVCVAE